jgi:hypothetical protein
MEGELPAIRALAISAADQRMIGLAVLPLRGAFIRR